MNHGSFHNLGIQTDLLLHRWTGEFESKPDHVVMRTPEIPTFRWGHCLILARGPRDLAEVQKWRRVFGLEFPEASFETYYWRKDGDAKDVATFEPALEYNETVVLATAQGIIPRHRLGLSKVTFRRLDGDAEWQDVIELQTAIMAPDPQDRNAMHEFLVQRFRQYRRLHEAGKGAWFGAFLDGMVVADLGLFAGNVDLGDGKPTRIARFQNIETRPEFQRQGICQHLMAHAVQAIGPVRWVVVQAERGGAPHRLYASIGFHEHEVIASLSR